MVGTILLLILGTILLFGIPGALVGLCQGLLVQACPFCKEFMERGATVCPHCQRDHPAPKKGW